MNAVSLPEEHADDFPFAYDIILINIRYPGRLEKSNSAKYNYIFLKKVILI